MINGWGSGVPVIPGGMWKEFDQLQGSLQRVSAAESGWLGDLGVLSEQDPSEVNVLSPYPCTVAKYFQIAKCGTER